MSDSNQETRYVAKQTLLVFIIAAVALYVIGYLVMALGARLIGQPSLKPDVLASFINLGAVSPKPLERLVFLSVALSVVPILALTTFLVRRFPTRLVFPTVRVPSICMQVSRLWDFPQFTPYTRLTPWLAIGLVMILLSTREDIAAGSVRTRSITSLSFPTQLIHSPIALCASAKAAHAWQT